MINIILYNELKKNNNKYNKYYIKKYYNIMPQNDYVELHKKRFGERFDADEKRRKKAARAPHTVTLKYCFFKIYVKSKFS